MQIARRSDPAIDPFATEILHFGATCFTKEGSNTHQERSMEQSDLELPIIAPVVPVRTPFSSNSPLPIYREAGEVN